MITEVKLYLAQAAATLLQDEVMKPRGSAERRLRPRDLLQFGRCPARWVRGADADDALAAYGPTLTEWLAYEPKLAERHYVRRPDTYDAMVLRCPSCNSASLAQSCTKCGVRRRHVLEPRAWTSAAKHCADWNAKHERAGLRIVTGGEWDRATLGAANVRADRAIAGLAEESDALVLLTGTWHDEETGLDIPVAARSALLPREGSALDHTVAGYVEVRNADPKVWETQMVGAGAGFRAALVLGLANALGGPQRTNMLWMVVERDAPRLVARRRAAPEVLAEGRETLAVLMRSYAKCLETGNWPAFEAPGENSLAAWTESHVQPWMTAGQGGSGGYFAPQAVLGNHTEATLNAARN